MTKEVPAGEGAEGNRFRVMPDCEGGEEARRRRMLQTIT